MQYPLNVNYFLFILKVYVALKIILYLYFINKSAWLLQKTNISGPHYFLYCLPTLYPAVLLFVPSVGSTMFFPLTVVVMCESTLWTRRANPLWQSILLQVLAGIRVLTPLLWSIVCHWTWPPYLSNQIQGHFHVHIDVTCWMDRIHCPACTQGLLNLVMPTAGSAG